MNLHCFKTKQWWLGDTHPPTQPTTHQTPHPPTHPPIQPQSLLVLFTRQYTRILQGIHWELQVQYPCLDFQSPSWLGDIKRWWRWQRKKNEDSRGVLPLQPTYPHPSLFSVLNIRHSYLIFVCNCFSRLWLLSRIHASYYCNFIPLWKVGGWVHWNVSRKFTYL